MCCRVGSPLAAHTDEDDDDGDHEGRGGSDGPEQEHLTVGGDVLQGFVGH